ncbi:MAG: mycothiol synthase, partial [Actinomycetia bacterium]|nr:mycothiol synthase [Actinomycetes bacterium]
MISVSAHLSAEVAEQVGRLARSATEVDGVAALSEASRLALPAPSPAGTHHVLAESASAAGLLGYAQVWPDHSAELVVAPSARRQGIGTALWEQCLETGAERVWAHGDLAAARAFAATLGLEPVRSLLKMGRPLTADDRSPRPLPMGYASLTFAERAPLSADPVGELMRLNAAAFADHPEQGRLTREDLEARMAEPWFDLTGLIYVVESDAGGAEDSGEPEDPAAGPIAFHWTKVEPGSAAGEVYVVGVSPAYQGRGLAGPLTDLGLAHLVERGCVEVELYVDGENTPARTTYERAGLGVLTTDRVYAR